jgi:hypothetical protein
MLRDMDAWPGLTRSEAIRLAVERVHYLSTINSESVSALADRYEPVLRGALEDFDYQDFRTVARSLPDIVAGFLRESADVWNDSSGGVLETGELVNKLEALHHIDRMGLLDCIVAARHRETAAGRRKGPSQPTRRLSRSA